MVQPKFKKMLFIYGPSGAGKTSLVRVMFPKILFGQINLNFDWTQFNDDKAFDDNTFLWLFPDINEAISKDNIFRL